MSHLREHRVGDFGRPVVSAAPDTSWWCGLDRAAFTEKCADQQERIQSSYWGQRLQLVTADIPDRRTQTRSTHWAPAINQPAEIRMGDLAS